MNFSRACLLCCLWFASLLSADAIEVRFLAWDDEVAAREIALIDGGREKCLKHLHPLQRTDGMSSKPVAGALTLRALDRKDVTGKPVIFTVKVDKLIDQPLVLLLPDPKTPSGLIGLAIDDSTAAFPWGTFRVLNATGKALGIGLGTQRKSLPAGWKPVDLLPAGDVPLPVILVTSSEPAQPLYTSVWKPDSDLRRLVIVIPGTEPRLGPLALKVIPEDRRALAAVVPAP
jgi:hypothetical protein